MRSIVLFLTASATLVLAACGMGESGEITTEDGETVSYDIDSEGDGESTVRISGEDGEAIARTGSNVKADLPDGWSVYPGANVVSVMNMNSDDNTGMTVMMETNAAPDKIMAHYRKQAEAAGLEIELEMNSAGNTMLAGSDDNDRNFSISVLGDPGDDQVANLMLSGFEK
ncbi:MAG: hypothetical protein AAF707_02425 [Pseudomonadota bacterium]